MSAESHKGYDTWRNDLRLRMQMYERLANWVFTAQFWAAVLFAVVVKWPTLVETVSVYWQHLGVFEDPHWTAFLDGASELVVMFIMGLVLGTPVWLCYPFLVRAFRKRADREAATEHLSGTRIVPLDIVRDAVRKEPHTLSILTAKRLSDRIPNVDALKKVRTERLGLPDKAVERHIFIVGSTGVGKSVTISQLISGMIEAGHMAVIHDPDCEYVSRFYQPGRDLIFNPLDQRGLGWTIFNDLDGEPDYRLVSHVLVPQAQHSEPVWSDGARQILEAIIGAVAESEEKPTNARLWEVIQSGPVGIANFLKAHPQWRFAADAFLIDPTSRMSLSFTSTMLAAPGVSALKYLTDGDFSIADLFERKGGLVFLTNREKLKPLLKPLLSLFLELLGGQALSLPIDPDRRFYLVVDELGALHRINMLTRLPVQMRKRGGVLILGVQDFGQMDEVYGNSLRKSITNSCGNEFIFSVGDEDTAEALSRRIGEKEISETTESTAGGAMEAKEGFSISRRRHVERAVLGSHIIGLPVLQCYMRLSGYSMAKVQIVPVDYPEIAEGFIPRKKVPLLQGRRMEDADEAPEDTRAESGGGPRQMGLEDFM